MQLDRPILFFDLETTGLDVASARIIEFAGIKVFPDRRQERFDSLVNPGLELPQEVAELTGITDEMLANAPSFEHIMPRINELAVDADFAGYNLSGFDVPILMAECIRCGGQLSGPSDRAVVDPLEILRKEEVRTLSWAHQFYLDAPMEDAHRSMEDVEATMRILRAQIVKYEITGTPQDIQAKTRHPYLDAGRKLKLENGKVMINFGKHRGKSLAFIRQTQPDYIEWMMGTLDPEVANLLKKYS